MTQVVSDSISTWNHLSGKSKTCKKLMFLKRFSFYQIFSPFARLFARCTTTTLYLFSTTRQSWILLIRFACYHCYIRFNQWHERTSTFSLSDTAKNWKLLKSTGDLFVETINTLPYPTTYLLMHCSKHINFNYSDRIFYSYVT